MTHTHEQCDVVVVGGGPAGSATATFLAREGWRVVLLEKDHHPRFHIGESLLPLTMPILQRLGVMSAITGIGREKPGAQFVSTRLGRTQRYLFGEAIDREQPRAYQVRRAEFDEILFRNAIENGVDAREGYRVSQVQLSADAVRLTVVGPDGAEQAIHASEIIDASGRDTLLARKFGSKRRNPRHATAAMFAHFEGAELDAGPESGDIKICWFEHGWLWFIPFHDGVVSVGAVCSPSYMKTRKGGLDDFLADTVARVPELHGRLASARQIGDSIATGNYSYSVDELSGRRWTLVGDAFAFVDPMFSSGVHLALTGAQSASAMVDARLRGQTVRARRLQRRYRRGTQRSVRRFSWFIYRIMDPAMEQLFIHPSHRFWLKPAVTSVLAGDSSTSARLRLPLFTFRIIYAVASRWHRFANRSVGSAKVAYATPD